MLQRQHLIGYLTDIQLMSLHNMGIWFLTSAIDLSGKCGLGEYIFQYIYNIYYILYIIYINII